MNRGRCRRLRLMAVSLLLVMLSGHFVLAGEAPPCVSWDDAFSKPNLLNIAHAGASSIAPQNTLVAGQAAHDAGADVWGVDVRRTADGILVLMHDEALERTTDVEDVFPSRAPWKVADFVLAEICLLDAGSWFSEDDPFDQIAQGTVSGDTAASYSGVPVPTLREALEFVAANDWLIDIEVKSPFDVERSVVAAELAALVCETETTPRVLVSSFDHGFLRELRRAAPEISIGLLSLFPPRNGVEDLQALGADVYLPSVVGFTPGLLSDLEAVGIGVILWTYNRPSQWEYAADLPGVDGIYTDFPQRLTRWLEEREP